MNYLKLEQIQATTFISWYNFLFDVYYWALLEFTKTFVCVQM